MINIKDYELIPHKKIDNKYHIRCQEQSICPVCSSPVLKVIGSRNRKLLNSCGTRIVLVIRRLRCSSCKRIHHELPDCIVPYKRYSSESIEAILDDTEDTVSCEESPYTEFESGLAISQDILQVVSAHLPPDGIRM